MDATKENRFSRFIKREMTATKLLFRSIPSLVVALYVVAVVTMNLMAGKIILNVSWLALNGGVLISWIPFMAMDIVTKHFGARAANRLSILAIIVNLSCCLIFYIVSIIGSNPEFDHVFRGTWFILIGSTIAFLLSAITNNYSNEFVGKLFKKNPHGKLAYITRTYISTLIGQVIDNLAFVLPTYMLFAPIFWGPEYGWTFLQCFMCSLLCAIVELVLEIAFSPIGYRINRKWRNERVGAEYLEFVGWEE